MSDTGMTNEKFTEAVYHGLKSTKLCIIVVVYEHPKDFPTKYVGRAHFIGTGRSIPSPDIFIVKDTLDEVRAAIPSGMMRTARRAADDPCIVETYI